MRGRKVRKENIRGGRDGKLRICRADPERSYRSNLFLWWCGNQLQDYNPWRYWDIQGIVGSKESKLAEIRGRDMNILQSKLYQRDIREGKVKGQGKEDCRLHGYCALIWKCKYFRWGLEKHYLAEYGTVTLFILTGLLAGKNTRLLHESFWRIGKAPKQADVSE